MKKIIAIGITCVLLLTMSSAISTTGIKIITTSDEYDIYVDDDADPGWYDATHVKTIQEGVNNASSGNSIFVYNGTYIEHVVVNKSISLIGEKTENTIIEVNTTGNVIRITADWVNISGFTLYGNGNYFNDRGINIRSNYNTISNNNISGNHYGIYLEEPRINNILSDNTIINNVKGIFLLRVNNNALFDNIISDNSFGIWLYESCNNTLSGNTVINNDDGIKMHNAANNSIIDNFIASNNDNGIFLKDDPNKHSYNNISGNTIVSNHKNGIYVWDSSFNTISSNTFINNSHSGINLHEESKGNNISNNSFFNNGLLIFRAYSNNVSKNTVNDKPLVYLVNESDDIITDAGQVILVNCNNITVENLNLSRATTGIHLMRTNNSKIKNNDCLYNSQFGVFLQESSNNTISDNTISNNEFGIVSFPSFCNNNSITDNTVSNNGVCGIYLHGSYNIITGNTVSKSGFYGIAFQGTNNIIFGNTLSDSVYGVCLLAETSDNIIYHNNFINNTQNAYDECNNIWYNETLQEGNYWDDFDEPSEGAYDDNSDGIVDTPYNISGGDNKDFYPLMKPYSSGEPNLLVVIEGGIKCQIDVTILNQGTADATNVEYNISIEGGMLGLISEYKEGIIPEFKVGAKYIDTIEVFGLGFIDINVTVNGVSREHYGFVIGTFVIMSDYDET